MAFWRLVGGGFAGSLKIDRICGFCNHSITSKPVFARLPPPLFSANPFLGGFIGLAVGQDGDPFVAQQAAVPDLGKAAGVNPPTGGAERKGFAANKKTKK